MIGLDIKKIQKEYPEYIKKVSENYWWNFIILVLDSSFFSFSVAVLSQDTIVPYFVDNLTDKNWVVGLVPAIYYLGYFLPQLIGAFIVSRKNGKKWTIFKIALAERIGILAVALIAQFLHQIGSTSALVLFLISYLIFSTTNGMIIPGYSDFISKNIIRNRGIFYGFTNGLGGLVGFAASLIINRLLNNHVFPEDVRILFWLGFASSVVSPFLIASLREETYPFEKKMEPLSEYIRSIPEYIQSTPMFKKFMISRAVLGLGVMGNSFYALYAVNQFSLESGTLAIFTMIILLTRSAVGFLWGWIGDRYGYRYVYIIVSAMVILMGSLSLAAVSAMFFYIIAFCMGGVYAAFYIADSNMVFEIAPSSETSRFIGILNTFVSPVMALSPLIGGFFIDVFSHQFLFTVVLVIGVFSTLLAFLIMPKPRKSLSE